MEIIDHFHWNGIPLPSFSISCGSLHKQCHTCCGLHSKRTIWPSHACCFRAQYLHFRTYTHHQHNRYYNQAVTNRNALGLRMSMEIGPPRIKQNIMSGCMGDIRKKGTYSDCCPSTSESLIGSGPYNRTANAQRNRFKGNKYATHSGFSYPDLRYDHAGHSSLYINLHGQEGGTTISGFYPIARGVSDSTTQNHQNPFPPPPLPTKLLSTKILLNSHSACILQACIPKTPHSHSACILQAYLLQTSPQRLHFASIPQKPHLYPIARGVSKLQNMSKHQNGRGGVRAQAHRSTQNLTGHFASISPPNIPTAPAFCKHVSPKIPKEPTFCKHISSKHPTAPAFCKHVSPKIASLPYCKGSSTHAGARRHTRRSTLYPYPLYSPLYPIARGVSKLQNMSKHQNGRGGASTKIHLNPHGACILQAYLLQTSPQRLHFASMYPETSPQRLHFASISPPSIPTRLHFASMYPQKSPQRLHFASISPPNIPTAPAFFASMYPQKSHLYPIARGLARTHTQAHTKEHSPLCPLAREVSKLQNQNGRGGASTHARTQEHAKSPLVTFPPWLAPSRLFSWPLFRPLFGVFGQAALARL